MLAFALNVTIALVLKNCSAMGFIVAGQVKDILIVVASTRLFGDSISQFQYLGFAVTLAGCCAWAALKLNPNGAVALCLDQMLGGEHRSAGERAALIKFIRQESA